MNLQDPYAAFHQDRLWSTQKETTLAREEEALKAYEFPGVDAWHEELVSKTVPHHVKKILLDAQPLILERGYAELQRNWSRSLTTRVAAALSEKAPGLFVHVMHERDIAIIRVALCAGDLSNKKKPHIDPAPESRSDSSSSGSDDDVDLGTAVEKGSTQEKCPTA